MNHTEKHMRKAYVKAFGVQYDAKPVPLPLYIAYQSALRRLKKPR